MLIVQLISGYTQTEETWNGVQELREKLLSELDDYSTLSVRIRLDEWRSNWRAIARQLYMLRERYPSEAYHVIVFAYSWGVGNGLVNLARYLDRFGIDVAHAVISDGIYHHWFSAGNVKIALGSRIRIPVNVLRIEGFYQETSCPMGLLPVSETTKCEPWTKLRLPHVEMDDARAWHARCIEVAKEYAALSVGSPRNVPRNSPASAALDSRISEIDGQ